MTRLILIVKCGLCDSEDWHYAGKIFIVGNQTLVQCDNCQSMFNIIYGTHYSLEGLKKELGQKFAKLNKQNIQSKRLMAEMQRQIKKFEAENQ